MALAHDLRPQSLLEYVGQSHLIGSGKLLTRMIEGKTLSSMILWGPPGSGKTTLAMLLAKAVDAQFFMLSAVSTGKEALMKIVAQAMVNESNGLKTVLFIDEIHRWNKAQQDTLLPYVEKETLILIGATTENPSFEVNGALLSRSRVFVLKSLQPEELAILIDRALHDDVVGLGRYKKNIDKEAKELLIQLSGGDARIMLTALEMSIIHSQEKNISSEMITDIFQTKSAGLYDKNADAHYDTISAFIKSMRGSDIDAALYYLVRMLENGEDPKFVARRMIIFAAEDIGIADRGALIQANSCFESVQKVGMPECQLILASGVVYLTKANKSRAVPNALTKVKKALYQYPNEPIPLHLRNAPTNLMKEQGYGTGYTWSATVVGLEEGKTFLPEKLKGETFYS